MVHTVPLPIDNHKSQILEIIRENKVTIIQSFTGSGKTIRIPQFILEDFGQGCRIAVTQPRRVAVTSACERIAVEQKCGVGGVIVGYQMAGDKLCFNSTRIKLMTTGTLLQILINQQFLSEFTHIIVDEVHVRDISTDLLLLVLKKLLTQNSDWNVKLILLSATLDASRLKAYFDCGIEIGQYCIDQVASFFRIKELFIDDIERELQVFGIEQLDPNDIQFPSNNYRKIVQIVTKLDSYDETASVKGSVLIFLPGIGEIHALHEILESVDKRNSSGWIVLELHSSMTDTDQRLIVGDEKANGRKIMLATNIAESSITLPSIRYVIDTCLTRSLIHDNDTNSSNLQLELASKKQCTQRAGRTGRTADGYNLKLVHEKFYIAQMRDSCVPEMQRCGLGLVFLWLKNLKFGSPVQLLEFAMDRPLDSNVIAAVESLKECGALTINLPNGGFCDTDGCVTLIGKISTILSIDPRFARLICIGKIFNFVNEAMIIVSVLMNKSVFVFPPSTQGNLSSWIKKLRFAGSSMSDPISLVQAFKFYLSTKGRSDRGAFLSKSCLKFAVLRNVEAVFNKMKRKLALHLSWDFGGMELDVDNTNCLMKFNIMIAAAAYPQVYFRTKMANQIKYRQKIQEEILDCDPCRTFYIVPEMCHNKPTSIQLLEIQQQFVKTIPSLAPPSITWNEDKGFILVEYREDEEKFDESKIPIPMYAGLKTRIYSVDFQFTMNKQGHKMSCKGPFSPISMNFFSFNQSNYQSKVFLDRDSVNAISLDENFKQTTTYVASALKLSKSKNGCIILKEVTKMLPIKGLFTMINLLFSPRIQLRKKRNGQEYESALCGLGLSSAKGLPIASSRNIECLFDININSGDLRKINDIRKTMSDLMMKMGVFSDLNRNQLQSKSLELTDSIIKLLNEIRPSNADWAHITKFQEFKWKQNEAKTPGFRVMFPPHCED